MTTSVLLSLLPLVTFASDCNCLNLDEKYLRKFEEMDHKLSQMKLDNDAKIKQMKMDHNAQIKQIKTELAAFKTKKTNDSKEDRYFDNDSSYHERRQTREVSSSPMVGGMWLSNRRAQLAFGPNGNCRIEFQNEELYTSCPLHVVNLTADVIVAGNSSVRIDRPEAQTQKTHCLRVHTGTTSWSDGHIVVEVNGNVLTSANIYHALGSIVLDKCFTSLETVQVWSPNGNAWGGLIVASVNGSDLYSPLNCLDCDQGTNTSQIWVDGDRSIAQTALAKDSTCLDGRVCTLYLPCKQDTDCLSDGFFCTSSGICVQYDPEYCHNTMCGIGDGDCDAGPAGNGGWDNVGCADGLICGTDNCAAYHNLTRTGMNSGSDCCRPA